jgi:hypothetical protein
LREELSLSFFAALSLEKTLAESALVQASASSRFVEEEQFAYGASLDGDD